MGLFITIGVIVVVALIALGLYTFLKNYLDNMKDDNE